MYVNGAPSADDRPVGAGDLLHGRYALLRKGKRAYAMVVVPTALTRAVTDDPADRFGADRGSPRRFSLRPGRKVEAGPRTENLRG